MVCEHCKNDYNLSAFIDNAGCAVSVINIDIILNTNCCAVNAEICACYCHSININGVQNEC